MGYMDQTEPACRVCGKWLYSGNICMSCEEKLVHKPMTEEESKEVEESVIAKIRQRRDLGRKKYGVSMERTDLSVPQWLQHAQEEAMDLAIYLEKAIQEMNRAKSQGYITDEILNGTGSK